MRIQSRRGVDLCHAALGMLVSRDELGFGHLPFPLAWYPDYEETVLVRSGGASRGLT
jgi:hypothetical protein